MEMTAEPKTIESQAQKTVKIGTDFVVKPSRIRIIIELPEGAVIDPVQQCYVDGAIAELATVIGNAIDAFEQGRYELLPGEF